MFCSASCSSHCAEICRHSVRRLDNDGAANGCVYRLDRAGDPNSLGSPRGSLPARRVAPFAKHSVRDLCRTGHLAGSSTGKAVPSSIYIAWYVGGVGASLPQWGCSVGVYPTIVEFVESLTGSNL